MTEKTKLLSLTATKSVDVDGERRVTFVASDGSIDRDGEHMEIETLRLPLKGGGEMVVGQIPAEGTEDVDIPLLTNHDIWSVDKVIGSIRKATFVDGKLIFEAGISNREYAQDVFKLIDEGHLDNAFSISVNDYDYDHETDAISNGEIIEVSLVTRGSNKDAQVLAVKSAKEKSMDEESKEVAEAPEVNDEKPAEEAEETNEPKVEATDAEAKDETTEADEAKDVGETEKPAEETTNESKEKTMDKEITKSVARKEADQTITSKVAGKGYLDSKLAMHDLSRVIIANKGMNSDFVMNAWKNHLATKGIGGDIAQLPTALVSIFKGWEDHGEILSTLRRAPKATRTVFAFTGENGEIGETMRAKGHKKTEEKADQQPYVYARDLKGKLIYKRLPIDLQDLLDDETGEISLMRTEELLGRIDSEAERAVVVGDGRSAGTPDYRIFADGRGIYSMASDILRSEGSGTTSNDIYAKVVATSIANVADDNIYDKVKKTIARVAGTRKYVVVAAGAIAELETQKADGTGIYLFPNGINFGDNVVVFERDWMVGSGYDVIAYNGDRYNFYYGNSMIRTNFDSSNNQDIMLAERYTSGSAEGYKAVAGYKSTD